MHTHARACVRASKNMIFWKIQNKYFYLPYSNETFYMKALEYKEYLIYSHRLWTNSEEFRRYSSFFLDMKYRMFFWLSGE
jgi:hypothetical protein